MTQPFPDSAPGLGRGRLPAAACLLLPGPLSAPATLPPSQHPPALGGASLSHQPTRLPARALRRLTRNTPPTSSNYRTPRQGSIHRTGATIQEGGPSGGGLRRRAGLRAKGRVRAAMAAKSIAPCRAHPRLALRPPMPCGPPRRLIPSGAARGSPLPPPGLAWVCLAVLRGGVVLPGGGPVSFVFPGRCAVSGLVGFAGPRVAPPAASCVVVPLVAAALAAGRSVAVGCCSGVDALVVSSVLAADRPRRLAVFAAFGPAGAGAGRWSSVAGVAAAAAAGASVRWWAGGGAAVALSSRLPARTRSLVASLAAAPGSSLVVVFGPAAVARGGSFLAARSAAAAGVRLLAVCPAGGLPPVVPGGVWSPARLPGGVGGFVWSPVAR